MKIRFLTWKMRGRLIHELDLYTSKYGTLHYTVAHRSTRHRSISSETSPSWQKTLQMPINSSKKCAPQPHSLVTAGIEIIVLVAEKSTDTTTTTAMLPIGGETIYYPKASLLEAGKKRGPQTTNKHRGKLK